MLTVVQLTFLRPRRCRKIEKQVGIGKNPGYLMCVCMCGSASLCVFQPSLGRKKQARQEMTISWLAIGEVPKRCLQYKSSFPTRLSTEYGAQTQNICHINGWCFDHTTVVSILAAKLPNAPVKCCQCSIRSLWSRSGLAGWTTQWKQ